MNSMADQISNLPEEQQEQFHRFVQKSLKRQRAKAKAQTEQEIDYDQTRTNRPFSRTEESY